MRAKLKRKSKDVLALEDAAGILSGQLSTMTQERNQLRSQLAEALQDLSQWRFRFDKLLDSCWSGVLCGHQPEKAIREAQRRAVERETVETVALASRIRRG